MKQNKNIYVNVWQVVIINDLTQEQLNKAQEELSEKSIVSVSDISKLGVHLTITAQTNSLNSMQLYDLLAKVIERDGFEVLNIGTLGPFKQA